MMRRPRKVIEQRKLITPELQEEKLAAMRLLDFFAKEQSPEYTAAAKAVNEKLRAAGLNSLVLIEN